MLAAQRLPCCRGTPTSRGRGGDEQAPVLAAHKHDRVGDMRMTEMSMAEVEMSMTELETSMAEVEMSMK
eukprot:1158826-Pelagomonas_calceolata.AAC.1